MDAAWLVVLLPLAAASGWWFGSRRYFTQEKQTQNFNQSCLQGINQLLALEDDEALTAFLETMDQQPQSVELQMVLGSLCRRKGEYERASLIHQSILNHQSHSDQTREQAQFELAQDYQAAGWLDRSESLYVELLKSDRYQIDTANNLLRIYQHEKDWENAIQTGNYLRKLGHQSDALLEQLAHFYCELCEESIKNGRFPIAENYLAEALKIDPNSPRVLILQGRIASFKGDHKRAVAAWKKLELVAPAFLGIAMGHVQDSFQLLQDKPSYIKFLKQAVKSSQDPEVLSALLETLKTENKQSASQYLLQYMKDKPNVSSLKQVLLNWQDVPTQIDRQELRFIVDVMADLVRGEGRFQCIDCGFKAESFEWMCPGCQTWGTYERILLNIEGKQSRSDSKQLRPMPSEGEYSGVKPQSESSS
jgi:lipopolysaccharide biosynthesis regulator YciM